MHFFKGLMKQKTVIGISLKKIEGSANMTCKNNQPAAVRKANEKAKFVKYEANFFIFYGCLSLLWIWNSLKNFKQEILVGLQKVIGS